MDEESPDFEAILQCLMRHDVTFMVVGGVAAVLQGAPISTFDLDILYQHTAENLGRLMEALTELQALYRGRGDERLAPAADHFSGQGHALLETKAGPLDVLGMVGNGQTFDDLQPTCERIDLGEFSFHVLDLPNLIRLKEELGREKDQATLPILRRILREREE